MFPFKTSSSAPPLPIWVSENFSPWNKLDLGLWRYLFDPSWSCFAINLKKWKDQFVKHLVYILLIWVLHMNVNSWPGGVGAHGGSISIKITLKFFRWNDFSIFLWVGAGFPIWTSNCTSHQLLRSTNISHLPPPFQVCDQTHERISIHRNTLKRIYMYYTYTLCK